MHRHLQVCKIRSARLCGLHFLDLVILLDMPYLTRDVFTPTKPARIAFVERDSVNDKLVNSLTTPGKQIVVYGHSGTGKTTLLVNKLTQLYERHITTRCMKGLKFEQLILDAFDQLEPALLHKSAIGQGIPNPK